MPTNVKEMLAAANALVPRVPPEKLREMMDASDALVVDVRDAAEVQQSGRLKGALNVSRGMLEFRADPESPYYNPAFQKGKRIVLYCASGGRAALSGKTLSELGYAPVFNAGGFKELAEAGIPTETA